MKGSHTERHDLCFIELTLRHFSASSPCISSQVLLKSPHSTSTLRLKHVLEPLCHITSTSPIMLLWNSYLGKEGTVWMRKCGCLSFNKPSILMDDKTVLPCLSNLSLPYHYRAAPQCHTMLLHSINYLKVNVQSLTQLFYPQPGPNSGKLGHISPAAHWKCCTVVCKTIMQRWWSWKSLMRLAAVLVTKGISRKYCFVLPHKISANSKLLSGIWHISGKHSHQVLGAGVLCRCVTMQSAFITIHWYITTLTFTVSLRINGKHTPITWLSFPLLSDTVLNMLKMSLQPFILQTVQFVTYCCDNQQPLSSTDQVYCDKSILFSDGVLNCSLKTSQEKDACKSSEICDFPCWNSMLGTQQDQASCAF